jgi:predicted ATPase/DNA-binding winged helix-turn-helix (wHTH) protein
MLLEADKPVRLGSRALEILVVLVERPGEMVSKRELVARVWPNTVVEEANLKVHIAALRRALSDGRDGNRYLVNVPGRGYKFVAPVLRPRPPAVLTPHVGSNPHQSQIPSPLTRMLGREDVVETVSNKLSQARVVTIVGPGGIGKTKVALAVAAKLIAANRDGGGFIDLAPLADPLLVPSAMATMLGVPVRSENPISGLIAFLTGKQMLIVLDSCEHLVSAVALMASKLLEGTPDLRILATSREPLRLAGESVLRLPPLKTPDESETLTVAQALSFPSIQLFVDRACERIATFRLTDTDAPRVGDICRKLDGNPLAIELAAGRVDAFGVRGVATQLNDRFGLLTSGFREAPPRQQSLMVTLDWSYDLLSEIERAILRRLGVFAGYFTLDAATDVATGGAVSSSDVLAGMATLVDKSLVSADVGSTVIRFRLLDTTAAYARKKLADNPGECEQIARRHAEFIIGLLERAEPEATLQRSAERPIDFGAQIDNVRAALNWSFSSGGDPAMGVNLTIAALCLWQHLSLLDECRRSVNRALEFVKSGSTVTRRQELRLLTGLGVALWMLPESGTVWTKVLEIAEELGDIDYRLRALWGLWIVSLMSGNHRTGLSIAKQFSTLAAKTTDPLALFAGDRLIGSSLHYLGEQRRARRRFEIMMTRPVSGTARTQIIRFQYDLSVARRAFLARILWLQGFPDQAAREAEGGVIDAQESRHSLSLCYALGHAAAPIALFNGDTAGAQRNILMLLEHSARYELLVWEKIGRCFSGMLNLRRGLGMVLLSEAMDELRAAGLAPYCKTTAIEYAKALGSVGEIARALATIDEALAHSTRNEELWCLPEMLRVKGELLLLDAGSTGIPAAESHFHKSLALARKQTALSWELRTAISLARLQKQQHREKEARELLARPFARFTEGFETPDVKAAKLLLNELNSRLHSA